jgi:hypothetical protein
MSAAALAADEPAPARAGSRAPVVMAGELPGAAGGLAAAAAVAVALARREEGDAADGPGAALLVELGAARGRGPTMLAAEGARELERALRAAGFEAAARGRLAWVTVDDSPGWAERVGECLDIGGAGVPAIVVLPPAAWSAALADERIAASAALLRADLPAQRALAALAVVESRAAGLRVRVASRSPGRVATRRALAGIDPGGEAGARAARLARGLAVPRSAGRRLADPGGPAPRLALDSGQATPLVLGALVALVATALALAAFGGAVTGKSRAQRAADLSALSAARSLRDDFDRLFAPVRLASGAPNPAHLERSEYLARAQAAAREAAMANGAAPRRVELSFPDSDSFAPLRVRAELVADLDLRGSEADAAERVWAEAEAVVPAPDGGEGSPGPAMASGGGYSGPLEYRQGEPMRPDVAEAFDRMAAAARADGVALYVNSGFRSDAEQAELWAANPDPRWVAPPGTSLHRCATELDLGPPSAYGWLAANAGRFGFVQRYSWEAWHYGFTDGPAPCSAAGDHGGIEPARGRGEAGGGDGATAGAGLPAFVPARFRDAISAAASRWNVSPALLAAQLMAESNFNPFAVSPAGAAGIAQFMPGTAAAYGLDDPFDPEAAIDAQAHLMSDLLSQFDGEVSLALAAYNAGPAPVEACGCVPSYPETQDYVARILGLMDGAGAIAAPTLEVRLVE